MKRDQPLVDVDDEDKFFKMSKAAFGQRRKPLTIIIKVCLWMEKQIKKSL